MEAPSLTRQHAQDAAPTSKRDLLLMGGLLGLVVAGLIGLAVTTGWEETWNGFKSLSLCQFFLLLGLSLINYLARAARWHVFARSINLPVALWQSFRHFLGGFAMSVTPGRVGELVRIRWIHRETGAAFEKSAPLMLIDRAADLSIMAVLLALALTLAGGTVAGGAVVAGLALLAALLATRPYILRLSASIAHRLTGRRWPNLFARVRRAGRSLQAFLRPAPLLIGTSLGLAGWFAEGYAFYLLLGWLGAEIGLWMAMAIFLFSTLAGGLTGAPGGLGGAEAAMVALLVLDGVPLETALPATIVIRATTLWFAIGIGLMVFPIAERKSARNL